MRIILTLSGIIGVALGLWIGRMYYPPQIKIPASYTQYWTQQQKDAMKPYLRWEEPKQ